MTIGAGLGRRQSSRCCALGLALLSSVSALAMLVHATPAEALCLRCGGGGETSATSAAATSAIMSAQQATAATQQSMNALARATQAVQAMQNAQTAARNLAASTPSNVPNGLAPGGLVPDPVTPWIGANTPTQTTSGNSATVTIQQTQSQALLTWSSFNVGANTTLNFNQQPGWLAINKVNNPSGVPSQILGTINAPGQVYLINRNGIIFGGTSQVNVGTLVASALPINNALVQAGALYSNLDAQFTFSSYSQQGGTLGPTNPFAPNAATLATQDSKVIVQAGRPFGLYGPECRTQCPERCGDNQRRRRPTKCRADLHR